MEWSEAETARRISQGSAEGSNPSLHSYLATATTPYWESGTKRKFTLFIALTRAKG